MGLAGAVLENKFLPRDSLFSHSQPSFLSKMENSHKNDKLTDKQVNVLKAYLEMYRASTKKEKPGVVSRAGFEAMKEGGPKITEVGKSIDFQKVSPTTCLGIN